MRRIPFLLVVTLITSSTGCFQKTLEDVVNEAVEESFDELLCADELLLSEAEQAGREAAYEDMASTKNWCDNEPVLGVREENQCYDRAYNVAYQNTWIDICYGSDTGTN